MKKKSPDIRLVKSKQDCGHCDIQELCVSVGIEDQYTEKLNEIVKQSGAFDAGQIVYRRGDNFKSLYVIQSGIAKSETGNIDGRQQVTGFYFPGDLIGIESISTKKQPCDLIAVEKTRFCEIPFAELEKLCTELPELQHELFLRMGQRIHHDEFTCLVNRGETVERRILLFLTEIFQKLGNSKYVSANCLSLPMTKADISSYLGLQPETFSRSLKQLQKKGYIKSKLKHVEILDLEGMLQVVENHRHFD